MPSGISAGTVLEKEQEVPLPGNEALLRFPTPILFPARENSPLSRNALSKNGVIARIEMTKQSLHFKARLPHAPVGCSKTMQGLLPFYQRASYSTSSSSCLQAGSRNTGTSKPPAPHFRCIVLRRGGCRSPVLDAPEPPHPRCASCPSPSRTLIDLGGFKPVGSRGLPGLECCLGQAVTKP